MKLLKSLYSYYFFCGIDKEEYAKVKKDAYVSNYKVWRILHYLMAFAFGLLLLCSPLNGILKENRLFYLSAFLYSIVAMILFHFMKKDSLAAQLLIYLSISVLFLYGCFVTQNKPDRNATTFIALLLIAPMFMIDRPFFMTIELGAASAVFLTWMYGIKPYDVWQLDCVNVFTFTIIGSFLNVIANSVRIREFVLTRRINLQKDTDELTGLKNKGALTREINACLADESMDKGILFVLDVDRFKSINDTYGHDVGDDVIVQLGSFLGNKFQKDEIVGRFGGDEFIVFIKNMDDIDVARKLVSEVIKGAAESVLLPERKQGISVSIGICIYRGSEKNYSEIFKKADMALYQAKADAENRYRTYQNETGKGGEEWQLT